MKLVDLHPHWIGAGGEGIYNANGTKATKRHGVGVLFDCPCGNTDDMHQLYVPFSNPLDGGEALVIGRGWQR